MQDCEVSESVVAAPWSGGGNMHGNARTLCVPIILSYLRMKIRCLVI